MRREDLTGLDKNESLRKAIHSWIQLQVVLLITLAIVLGIIVCAIVFLAFTRIPDNEDYIVSVIAILFALALFILGAFSRQTHR